MLGEDVSWPRQLPAHLCAYELAPWARCQATQKPGPHQAHLVSLFNHILNNGETESEKSSSMPQSHSSELQSGCEPGLGGFRASVTPLH